MSHGRFGNTAGVFQCDPIQSDSLRDQIYQIFATEIDFLWKTPAGAPVYFGSQAPVGGALHRALSYYPVLCVATPPSAALLLQTDISLVLRVIYLLTFTSPPPRPFITLLYAGLKWNPRLTKVNGETSTPQKMSLSSSCH